jgi:bacterioferritin-associated ferredoxin
MIVCSCGVVTDARLLEAARAGLSWREARKLLNVTNNPRCCRCSSLTKPMFMAARRAAGFEDHPHDSEHHERGEKQ